MTGIVVGDLPYKYGHGDFYLSVDCCNNPTMVTSVAEDKHPKAVHFSETITLRIHETIGGFEAPVVITVKEMCPGWSRSLCQVTLSTHKIAQWSRDYRVEMRRFQMRSMDHDFRHV